ncbi:MAG: NAD-dependent epimerase/dehydratase family protein, partial [Bdellovibrionia bacterium]
MSRVVEPILFNGSTGSIGSSMPATALPVKSRLESSLTDIQTELKEVSGGHAFVFIHLAGLVRVEDCEKDPALARALNVDGAEKFYHAASAAGCSHFVYVSSAHVYAASKEKLKVGDPLGPRSEYARTKRDA